tara:strand:- start:73 stop:276 length:204 start_codon:yes stop_codon:yes gene_type:complete
MNIKTVEKEILKALEINTKVDWWFNETTPREEFKDLKKFVKKLFKEYNGGLQKYTAKEYRKELQKND